MTEQTPKEANIVSHGGQPKSGNSLINISKEDVLDEIKSWESTVKCYVIGANPSLEVIEGKICP